MIRTLKPPPSIKTIRRYQERSKAIIHSFIQATWKNAYRIRKSYSANGGSFSYAQQIANKSGKNVIGIIGEYTSQTEQKRSSMNYLSYKEKFNRC